MTMRLFRSVTLDSNANTYVGDALSLFVGSDYLLRLSDNATPGGYTVVGGGTIQSPTPPANPTTSTLWYDEVSGRLYTWYENVWVDASPAQAGPTGPPGGPTGPTGAASTVVGPTGPAVTGPTGASGADSMVTGPTGATSTVAGPTGATGSSANLGNLTISNQTIAGTVTNGNIFIAPNGTGRVVIVNGPTASIVPPVIQSSNMLQLQAPDQNGTELLMDSYSDDPANDGASIIFMRRWGGNSAAPTAVLVDQQLGAFLARGYNGTAIPATAFSGIIARATENFSQTNMGSNVEVWSTPIGTVTATKVATFTDNSLITGNIRLTGNTISLTNSAVNLNLGVPGQLGNVVVNSTLKVVDGQGNVVLTNSTAGQIYVVSGYQNPDKSSVLNVIGNWGGASNVPTNPGGMLQITGHDGVTSRVINDSYGSSVFSVFVGRKANGTAAAPTTTQAGSVARFSSAVYAPTLGFVASSVSPGYMDIQLLATATDTSQPTRIAFYTAPSGSLLAQNVANVDTGGITLPYAGSGITFADGSKQTSAGGASNVVVINGPTYAMTNIDRFVGVNYAVAPVTVTLPSTATCVLGTTVIIKDTGPNATTQPITIAAYAGDSVDGAGSVTITQNYNSYTLIYSAANAWSII